MQGRIFQPGLSAGFIGQRNSPESPRLLTRLGVECIDEAPDAELCTRNPHDNLVLYNQRRSGACVSFVIVVDHHVVNGLTCLYIEGDQMRVERDHQQFVVIDGQPPIHVSAAHIHTAGRQSTPVTPQHLTGLRINRPGVIVLTAGIDDAVNDDGRALPLSQNVGLEGPHGTQLLDVVGSNFLQGAVPLTAVVTGIAQPARRIS